MSVTDVKKMIHDTFAAALDETGYAGSALVLEKPRQKEHGDICTPVALGLAKLHKKNPMVIAEEIATAASFPEGAIESVDVARPGFINLRLSRRVLVENVLRISGDEGESYGRSDIGRGAKCLVEYVSANPTGPLVIVSARAAAVGSVIVNLLRAVGFAADGEYYVNDYGNQVRKLGASLRFRVREIEGKIGDGEEIGDYPGEYLKAVAAAVPPADARGWEADGDIDAYGRFATDYLLETIEADLEKFGVDFEGRFFRESTLHPAQVEAARKLIEQKGFTYTKEGALYFKTTEFGDEKDRVLVKSDGNPTYFLGDIAYHRTKLERGYQSVLNLLGPDHHGHIPRMQAAAAVLGAGADWLDTIVVGWVRLMEGATPVSMSKRAGEFITLRELIDDVGSDVAKYFFLMRRANSPLDFDLQLARTESDENPVFYVQYAHARIASIGRFAEGRLQGSDAAVAFEHLDSEEERDLMVHLLFFPYEVEAAALAREPHRLTVYARDLAALFHRFYHEHRVVTDDERISGARWRLVQATQHVLRNALHLMGVSAPGRM